MSECHVKALLQADHLLCCGTNRKDTCPLLSASERPHTSPLSGPLLPPTADLWFWLRGARLCTDNFISQPPVRVMTWHDVDNFLHTTDTVLNGEPDLCYCMCRMTARLTFRLSTFHLRVKVRARVAILILSLLQKGLFKGYF